MVLSISLTLSNYIKAYTIVAQFAIENSFLLLALTFMMLESLLRLFNMLSCKKKTVLTNWLLSKPLGISKTAAELRCFVCYNVVAEIRVGDGAIRSISYRDDISKWFLVVYNGSGRFRNPWLIDSLIQKNWCS